ncbi:MAG: DEAD/DEAH box helicase [Deltaproteobacteria bacterium]|jgi:ATP-dependent DNA helicase RecG|nr:DEAD/DEAH box helicase [Deltaproteobacteria bacterium]
MIPWPDHPAFAWPLCKLPGLGPARASELRAHGFEVCGDLLTAPPRRYQDRRSLVELAEAVDGQELVFCGRLQRVTWDRGGRWLRAELDDGTASALLWWFNGLARLRNAVYDGRQVEAFGLCRLRDGRPTFTHPELRSLDSAAPPGVTPVYDPVGRLSAGWRRVATQQAARLLDDCPPALPPEWLAERQLTDPVKLLSIVHRPPADAQGPLPRPKESRSWRTLGLHELLCWRLTLSWLRAEQQAAARDVELDWTADALASAERFWRQSPFEPSPEQRRATEEIVRDLAGPRPMSRLLQGEVGCGKTAVAAAAIRAVLDQGRQAAVMTPADLLARQHFEVFSRLGNGRRTVLLVGAQSARERREALAALASGEPLLAVGTQALASPKAVFGDLALAVIDEQQRFGVKQRAALRLNNPQAAMLCLSATPIPRSLAAVLYGDLELTVMRGALPGRRRPKTVLFAPDRAEEGRRLFAELVLGGEQGFVVCPRIGEDEDREDKDADARSGPRAKDQARGAGEPAGAGGRPDALGAARALQTLLPRLGLIHGRLSAERRDAVMDRFRSGELRALVSTTIVEVGVDVPAANVMLVEGAENFGLAQLHQLRGRVGRGGGQGVFLMLAATGDPAALARLAALEDEDDGLALAELDLKLRGPGQELGLRQSGWPLFKFAKLPGQLDLLPQALELAEALWARRADWPPDFSRRVAREAAALAREGQQDGLASAEASDGLAGGLEGGAAAEAMSAGARKSPADSRPARRTPKKKTTGPDRPSTSGPVSLTAEREAETAGQDAKRPASSS